MSASFQIAPILRSAWPRHTAKEAARAAGVSIRTVHGWLAARCVPSSSALLRMAASNDQMRAVLIRTLQGNTHEGMVQMDLFSHGAAVAGSRAARERSRDHLAQQG